MRAQGKGIGPDGTANPAVGIRKPVYDGALTIRDEESGVRKSWGGARAQFCHVRAEPGQIQCGDKNARAGIRAAERQEEGQESAGLAWRILVPPRAENPGLQRFRTPRELADFRSRFGHRCADKVPVRCQDRDEAIRRKMRLNGPELIGASRVQRLHVPKFGDGDEKLPRSLDDAGETTVPELDLAQGNLAELRLALLTQLQLRENLNGYDRSEAQQDEQK